MSRWAVILGVSSGTGAAIARAAAAAGWNIFGVHRGSWPHQAEVLERDIKSCGVRAVFWQADATTPDAAQLGASLLRREVGAGCVGLMVHSVAAASVGYLAIGDDPLAPRQLQATMDRMAHSFVWWVQALEREGCLSPHGAQLLGLSNLMTENVIRGSAAIAASKAALEMYVRHLAVELGPKGHRVNLLKFSMVVTQALHETFSPEAVDALVRTMRRTNPAGRLLTVEEVGKLVVFLATDAARWFNGATLDYCGGESLAFFDALIFADKAVAPSVSSNAPAAPDDHKEEERTLLSGETGMQKVRQ
ncbi:MAG: 3-oxoacyl-[acyl-carrier protein] reductase [Kiritimatiellia bacterium]|jgi:3-oxoacyl-[acyl-carrier protein] reductase